MYMAPELVSVASLGTPTTKYSRTVDTYSFGVMCYEILMLKRAWAKVDFVYVLYKKVCSGKRPVPSEEALRGAPTNFYALLQECWAQDPDLR